MKTKFTLSYKPCLALSRFPIDGESLPSIPSNNVSLQSRPVIKNATSDGITPLCFQSLQLFLFPLWLLKLGPSNTTLGFSILPCYDSFFLTNPKSEFRSAGYNWRAVPTNKKGARGYHTSWYKWQIWLGWGLLIPIYSSSLFT